MKTIHYKFLQTIFFASALNILYGQDVKNFSGGYKNGTASYSFFEKDGERIYHGFFSYKGSTEVSNAVVRTITGNFSKGFKTGKWLFSDNLTTTDNEFQTYQHNVSGNYLDGERTGVWTINFKSVTKKRTMISKSLNTVTYSSSNESLVSIAHFKDNLFEGDFYLKEVNKFGEFNEFKGQFNNNGYMDGVWYFFSKDASSNSIIKTTLLFTNGFLRSSLEMDSAIGEILHKKDNSLFIDSVEANMDKGTAISFFNGQFYEMKFADDEYYFARIWRELELLNEITIGEKEIDYSCEQRAIKISDDAVYKKFKDSVSTSSKAVNKLLMERGNVQKKNNIKSYNDSLQEVQCRAQRDKWSSYKSDLNSRSNSVSSSILYTTFLDYFEFYFRSLHKNTCSKEDREVVMRFSKVHDKLMTMSDSEFKNFWKQFNLTDFSAHQFQAIESALTAK